MMKVSFAGVAELEAAVGRECAVSDWFEVTQHLVNQFADLTEDHNWIHVDVSRASAESPFGTTIAHGFLSLSLLTKFMLETISVEGIRMGVNYGLERVRFVSPVTVGSLIRARFTLMGLETVPGGVQTKWNVVIERQGSDKPCCVVEWLLRYFF